MSDTKRIVVAIDSANAEKKISAVKKGLSEVGGQQEKNLKLTKLQLAADRAQIQLEQARKKQRQAANELSLAAQQSRAARRSGASSEEMQKYALAVKKAQEKFMLLENAEALAGLKW